MTFPQLLWLQDQVIDVNHPENETTVMVHSQAQLTAQLNKGYVDSPALCKEVIREYKKAPNEKAPKTPKTKAPKEPKEPKGNNAVKVRTTRTRKAKKEMIDGDLNGT